MTSVALVGASEAISSTRRRLERSPLAFDLVDDPASADLVVTDEAPPASNYLTVAAAQEPNRFFCRDESVDYIVAALTEAQVLGARGVRVRPPVQDHPTPIGRRRRWRRPVDPLSRFDPIDYDWLTDETVEAEVFDDDVRIAADGEEFTARLRARGHIDGNDGLFHWAGILHGQRAHDLFEAGSKRVEVSHGDHEPVAARLAELNQWGSVRMTGVGKPPWMTD
ncbi:DUF4873 domain-containing protein [Gordonia sp. X0973]|uniref:DUF4873 domain-containing protein n=1 Tax=Gordonia sp. X0973 TaxID=2742602 RepID=UPI000F548CFE|nr:DUF4873 domain-containing protein [Gordonia sp. X0973]QKT05835.1 DUF4873 domain-containing protein [Gordonia sp. X0973]